MIVWDDNIVYDAKTSENSLKIRKRIEKRKLSSGLNYCVSIAVNENNLFDIYNMGELLFRYHRDSDEPIHIVAIASSKKSAIELAGYLIEKIFRETGTTDVRSYYLGKKK